MRKTVENDRVWDTGDFMLSSYLRDSSRARMRRADAMPRGEAGKTGDRRSLAVADAQSGIERRFSAIRATDSAVRVENGTTRTSAGGRQREQRATKGSMIKHRASGPLRRLHRNTRAGYAGWMRKDCERNRHGCSPSFVGGSPVRTYRSKHRRRIAANGSAGGSARLGQPARGCDCAHRNATCRFGNSLTCALPVHDPSQCITGLLTQIQ